MKLTASPAKSRFLPGMHDSDLEEAMFTLAGTIDGVREAIRYNTSYRHPVGRYSAVLNQEDFVEAVENIGIISGASREAVKDVLESGKRRYQLRELSFLQNQNSLPTSRKNKYMSINEINRLAALLMSLDQMKNRDLLEGTAGTAGAVGWLVNMSNELDKCGEFEKADALDRAASILVMADQLDSTIKTSDLILAAVWEFGVENPKRLKEFLLNLPPKRLADLEDIVSSKNSEISEENQADLMFAWQLINEPFSTKKDELDLSNPQYRQYRFPKLNQRVFNLLCLAANYLEREGQETKIQDVDSALGVLIELANEFD